MANQGFAKKDFVLECVQGKNAANKPVFAYVLLLKDKLASLQKALKEGNTDLTTFGLVVATGEGVKPGAAYEQELIASLKKAQKL
ncbi:MAG: hypothetical protein EB060_06400 [Proteobacteria bacterium]|nr:hypothetical protein [Pseudomonadota bacterium]